MSVYQKVGAVASQHEKSFEQRFEQIESFFVEATVTSGLDLSTPAAVIIAADSIEITPEAMTFEIREFLKKLEDKPNWLRKFETFTGLTLHQNKLMTLTRSAANKLKEKEAPK